MRVLTNYLQILAISLSFNLQFPSYMVNVFSSVKSVGGAQDVFLSFDCLLMNTTVTDHFDTISFLKVMCLAFIPIVLIMLTTLMYFGIYFRNIQKAIRLVWVTTITIFFLFYPSLTQYALIIFKCNDIGSGNSRVQMNVQQECWSPNHLKWVFSLGKSFLPL